MMAKENVMFDEVIPQAKFTPVYIAQYLLHVSQQKEGGRYFIPDTGLFMDKIHKHNTITNSR